MKKLKENLKLVGNIVTQKIGQIKSATLAILPVCLNVTTSFAKAKLDTAPIDHVKDILVVLAGSIGTIVILIAIIAFAFTWGKEEQDKNFEKPLRGLAVGVILLGADVILSILLK